MMESLIWTGLLYLGVLVVSQQAEGSYFITIDPHEEECFFEKVKQGTKLSLSFEVAEGGFLDIDIKINGPDGNMIHEGERESNGRYTFPASMDGVHTYCFSNKMSTLTPKIVMFSMIVGDMGPTPKPDTVRKEKEEARKAMEEENSKIQEMLREMSAALSTVKHEQEYTLVRERIHRGINDNTNSRVVIWSVFEALVLVVMTITQVYYLKQFFEVRRTV